MNNTPISIITPPELRRQGERWNVVYYEKKRLRRVYVGSVNLPKSEINRRANEIIARILSGEPPKEKPCETLKEALIRLTEIHVCDLRSNSQKVFRCKINCFISFLEKKGYANLPVWRASVNELEEFRAERIKLVNPNTVKSELISIKMLYNKLNIEDKIQVDTSRVQQRNGEQQLKETYTKEERDALFAYVQSNEPELYLIYILVHYSFIRPTEILKLTWGNVDLERRMITIPGTKSKNKKTERVEIGDGLFDLLKSLHQSDKEKLLICKSKKDSAFLGELHKRHKNIVERLGLNKSLTIYGLKHTGVKMMYAQTKDIDHIRELCRHSNISITYTYLRGLGESICKGRTIKGVDW